MATELVNCGIPKLDFEKLLACCVVTRASDGLNYLNSIQVSGDCESTSITSILNCNTMSAVDYESVLNSIFAFDDCGNLAIKIYSNTGSAQ